MMKRNTRWKIRLGLLLLLALVLAVPFRSACAATDVNYFFWRYSNPWSLYKWAAVLEYWGPYKSVEIPSTHAGGPVIAVEQNAFKGKGIYSIDIPSTVQYIESSAFENNQLTLLTTPGSVGRIGDNAFKNNLLRNITINEGIYSIGNGAFANNQLAAVTIYGKNVSFGSGVFDSNPATMVIYGDPGSSVETYAASNGHTFKQIFYKVNIAPSLHGQVTANILEAGVGTTIVLTVTPDSGYVLKTLKVDGVTQNLSHNTYTFTLPRHNVKVEATFVPPIVDLTYTSIPGGVRITGYNGQLSGALNIPDSLGGQPVLEIGERAFYMAKQLTSVVIPHTVTSIGAEAFSQNKLTSVRLGDSVTSIGNFAFYANQLTSIAFPASVNYIGDDAFGLNKLSSVTIPTGVTSISKGAFYGNQLTSISLHKGVTTIGPSAFAQNRLTDYSIPNSVESIGAAAFASNKLAQVTIPQSVTSIGMGAFSDNLLTSISIPHTVAAIDDYAFSGNLLTKVTIQGETVSLGREIFNLNPAGLTIFGKAGSAVETYATSNGFDFVAINSEFQTTPVAGGLKITGYTGPGGYLVLPETIGGEPVLEIGASAFESKKLTGLEIPHGITTIEAEAFQYNNLGSVNIPDSVYSIGDGAFCSCDLTSVVLPGGITSIGPRVFQYNKITSVIIPESVTSIADNAFASNDLVSVVIPDSVTSIGSSAFEYNDISSLTISPGVSSIGGRAFASNKLTEIDIPDTVKSIGSSAFEFNSSLTRATIHRRTVSLGSNIFGWVNKDFTLYGVAGSAVESYANNKGHKFVAIPPTLYLINISPTVKGTVTADKLEAECGDAILLTITPEAGFVLDSLTFNGLPQTVTPPMYSFNMPRENLVVEAAFKSLYEYLGTVTINYHDTEGNVIKAPDTYEGVGGTVTFEAPLIKGYQLAPGEAEQVTCEVTVSDQIFEHTFIYEASPQVNITLTAAENGSIGGGGTYLYNDLVILEAIPDSSYNFDGWYEGEVQVSPLPNYNFSARRDMTLTPRFVPMKKSYLEVTMVGGGTVWLNDEEVELPFGYKAAYYQNTDIRLTAVPDEGYTFGYWQDVDTASIVSTSPVYESHLGLGINIRAVFNKKPTSSTTSFAVIFQDRSGRILQSSRVARDRSAVPPTPDPTLYGYVFKGWDRDFSKVTSDLVIKPVFERTAQTYTVTVVGGILSTGGSSGEFKFDMPVTVVANTPSAGKVFSHWEQDGQKRSHQSTFTFYAPQRATTMTAVMVDQDSLPVMTPFITLADEVLTDTANKTMMFTATRAVPDGYTLVESGIMMLQSNTPPVGDLTLETPGAIRGKINNQSSEQFYIRKLGINPGDRWYARAYLIYQDQSGNMTTVYSGKTVNQTMS